MMKSLQRTTLFTALLLLLTSIHHVYGAIIYHTPWRLHILFIAIPVMILVFLLDFLQRRYPHAPWLMVLYIVFVLLFPLLGIGLYEGVYNHLFKNIIFLVTGDNSFFRMLFPPPAYEAPGDFWFEATGILQAFVFYPLVLNFRKMITFAVNSYKQRV